ncbi:ParB/RepB/Spo0J family partition protein [Mesorhizobium amorphae]|uniref:ParB/RepB/Spo0J family partition protein n=1 Tax=Mesorhizobium amorphae TaxID=71433 RepID=UPI001183BE5E|nr:ParB/RepB/Spo0J family partition protein [Mesorhizobium amorphae]
MIRTRSAEDQGLALALIQIDGGTQSRATLNDQVVDDYAEAIQAGATFPPIVVFYDGKKHWLADGFHRFHAYQKAGREKVAADVRQGTRRDAILHSVGANEAHGLRRTNDDKRRAILTLLNDSVWGKWTDREIARACHVDNKTVAKVRSEVTEEIPSERTYTTKHGTTATMKTAGINASRTQFQAKASEDNGSITGGAGAVTGEASRLASGRTDAGEAVSVDLPTISEAAREADESVAERNIFDELVALWKEADAGVRQDFKAYIKGSEAVAKINSPDGAHEKHLAAPRQRGDGAARQSGDEDAVDPVVQIQAHREVPRSAVPTAEAVAETPKAPRPSVTANNFQPLSRAEQVRLIRPNCQHPGTDLCAGSGRNHCHACKKLMDEAA